MFARQLKELLGFNFKHNFNTLITGQPGVGKTDIIKSAACDLGWPLLIEHSVVSEPTDYKGLPSVVNGQADFLPYGHLRDIMAADKPLICFFDDLGQAAIDTQKAIMQIILERSINGKKISNNVRFIAATNRSADKAGVNTILEPVKSRFATIVGLDVNVDDWIEWAIYNEMPVSLISFMRFKPSHLSDFKPSREIINSSCPRTIAHVGEFMKAGLPDKFRYQVFQGAAGEAFAREFTVFLEISEKLPDPMKILKDPDSVNIPESLDAKWAITGALAQAVSKDNVKEMLRYLSRMPEEFMISTVKDSITYKGKEISSHPSISEFAFKHRELILA